MTIMVVFMFSRAKSSASRLGSLSKVPYEPIDPQSAEGHPNDVATMNSATL